MTTDTEFDGTIESAISSLIQDDSETDTDSNLEAEGEEVEAELDDDQEEAGETGSDEDPDESDDESDDDESDDDEGEDDDDQEEEEDSDPDVYTVKVDGKEQQVTLEELKRGYSGQQYVQKGMQEAAELRKQTEEVYSALLSERQQVAQVLQQIQQGGVPQAPQPPSREMFDSDPIGYMEAKLSYDEAKAQYDNQMSEWQTVAERQRQADQLAMQAQLQREAEALVQAIPELGNKEKASQTLNKLSSKGQELYGFQADEMAQIVDHRAMRVLNDAIKYHELMAGKERAVEKAKPKNRKPVRAGTKKAASNKSAERQRRQKLRSSGSLTDALDLILE